MSSVKRVVSVSAAAAALVSWGLAAHASDITSSVVAVQVSSEQSPNVGRNTIDGDLATRWSANGDGQWVQYDLGTVQHIGNVTVAVYQGNTRSARFDLQIGNGSTFTTKWSGSSSGTTTALESHPVNGDARFLRLVGHGSTAGTWNSFTELHIYNGGIIIGPTPTPGGNPTPTPTPTTNPTTPPGGGFPAKTFAPYVETYANINPASVASSTGHKYYTLAFIISNGCAASWNGDTPMSANFYSSEISQLRAMGGDVIVSFGGAAGVELGQACTSASSLQAAYQSAVSKYGLKWIDLDIEGASIADSASVDRRNLALKGLQSANPGLRVSYTLPVMPTGLTQDGLNLMSNAKSRGVRVDVVNVMAMDYGGCGIDMGQAAIQAANATHSQMGSLGISTKIGVTPMIYVNDTSCENFGTQDASELTSFANSNSSWVGELAFWAVGRDPGYSQLNIFKAFR